MNDKSTSKARAIGGIGFFLLIVAVNIICTQFVAGRLGYHQALGSPIFGHVYQPFAWMEWFKSFYSYAPNTYQHTLLIFAAGIFISLLAYRIYTGLNVRSPRKNEGSHGTARFATSEDVRNSSLFPRKGKPGAGAYCGGYCDPNTNLTHYLRDNSGTHIAIIGPTGSGKGVGPIVCTLLSWGDSLLVIDTKGELYAITAGWRQKHANNIVLRFEPGEPDVGCAWNALEEIRFQTRYQVKDAQQIALIVVDTDGKGFHGDHWRTAAYKLLYGVILHALYKAHAVNKTPGIANCAYLLAGADLFSPPSEDDLRDVLRELDDGDPRALQSLFEEMSSVTLDSADRAAVEAQITIRGVGTSMLNTASKELASIISTAAVALSLYYDPIIASNTSHCDFKIADLMDHAKPVSLYFITSPDDLNRTRPLKRLLLTMIALKLATRMEFSEGRAKTGHKHRLLMMLDEFPTLGKLEVFQSALAYFRGYGIKVIIAMQDTQQLYDAYGQYESIISNCRIRLAFTPTRIETAEWLSRMVGQTTIIKEQISNSGKRFGITLESVSMSYQESSRPLMTPDEIMRMPEATKDENDRITEAGEMLVFVTGHPVIKAKQTPYFFDPTFDARSKIPPPTTPGSIPKTTGSS